MNGSGLLQLIDDEPREWTARITGPNESAARLSVLYDDPDIKFIIRIDLDLDGFDFDEGTAIVEDVPPAEPFDGPTILMNLRTNPGELKLTLRY